MICKLTKEKANLFKGLHLYNRLPRVQSQQTLNETSSPRRGRKTMNLHTVVRHIKTKTKNVKDKALAGLQSNI